MDFALDSTGDLDMSSNDLTLISGADAIAQHLRIRLRIFQGEWFRDLRVGIPYYQRVLLKNPQLIAVQGMFRRAITTTPGVLELQRFELAYGAAERKLTLTFSALLEGEDVAREFSEVFIL